MSSDDKGRIVWRDIALSPVFILIFFVPAFFALNYFFIFNWNSSYWLNNVIYIILLGVMLILMISSFIKLKHKPKRSYLKFLIVALCIFAVIYLVPRYLMNNRPELLNNSVNGFIATILLEIIFIIAILGAVRIRASYITEKGIRIGNDYPKNEEDIILKQKAEFIPWNSIKELKIKERHNQVNLLYYLYIKTKENTEFTSRLVRVKKFETTLRSLHKEKLLAKDYKYSKLKNANIPFEQKEKLADKMGEEDGV